MTLSDLEAFLTDNSVRTLTLIPHMHGWQIGLRARPGSPLHMPEAEGSDSYRMAHGATVPEVYAAMAALVHADDLFA
jgi:hypothetical protein